MIAELSSATTLEIPPIRWDLLPDDYPIPDDPVDNRTQPLLAAALTDSLSAADRLPPQSFTCTNYPICATLQGRIVLKAPDWAYVPEITVPHAEVNRSYTPHRQGSTLAIALEFLSHKEGGEYSTKPTYPPGKWFFYEQVLQVPYYGIFEPEAGTLELYRLGEGDRYQLQSPDPHDRYWIEALDLYLGVWQGDWEGRSGHWLRWWDSAGNLLLWSSEQAAQERQRADLAQHQAEQERQRADLAQEQANQAQQQAEQERQRAERLLAQLRAAGLEPDLGR